MFGLAAGRIMSLVLDGMPHWLLFAYLVVEVAFGAIGWKLLQGPAPQRTGDIRK